MVKDKRGRATRAAVDDSEEEVNEPSQRANDSSQHHARSSAKSKDKGKGKATIQATQTKGKDKGKGRAIQVESEEEEEEEEEEAGDRDDDDDAEEGGGKGKKGKSALSSQDKEELIRAMTRHILFSEYTRKLHSRTDIVKAVMPDDKGRYFNELIPKVQKNLRNVLGMELVALRPKERSLAKNPVKVYALRSTLPLSLLRAAATRPFPSLATVVDQDLAESSALARELANYAEDDDDDIPGSAEDRVAGSGGYLRDVKREEGAAYGILGVILALILVNGKVLGDDQLISYLRRLSLYPSSTIPLSPTSSHPTHLTLSAYLLLLCKQGYLERGASGSAPGAATSRAGHVPSTQRTMRGQGANMVEGGDPAIEYRWGARAEVEIGEVGVAQFIKIIFESKPTREATEDEEEEEDGGRGERRKGTPEEKKRNAERLMVELKRAAGTVSLQDAAKVEVTL